MPTKKPPRKSELPESIRDATLGTLKFICALDEMDEYSCSKKLGNRRVEMTLYTDEHGKLAPAIVRARKIVDRFPSIQIKIERYIEQKIFPNYNEQWRPNQKPYTLNQVLRKLKLQAITVHPIPDSTFWFEADDVFQWHCLQLMMGPRNVFYDYDTPG